MNWIDFLLLIIPSFAINFITFGFIISCRSRIKKLQNLIEKYDKKVD